MNKDTPMKTFLKLLLFSLIWSPLYSCLWLEGMTIDGEYKSFGNKTISSDILNASMQKTPAGNFRDRFYRNGDYTVEYKAIKEIIEKKYDEAIEKLLEIERETPNRYETASNLGTAYELNGNNRLAIKWINEGIKRNKDSHLGTEWLHVLILKTKIKLQKDSHYLDKNHIIDLPNSFDEEATININSKLYTISNIRKALFYQLRERMIFIKPKNLIVADLLYCFAKIEEQTTVLNEAEALLDMATEYGFKNKLNIEEIHSSTSRANILHKIRIAVYALIIILLIFLAYRHDKKSLKEKPITEISFVSYAFTVNIFILFFNLTSLYLLDFIISKSDINISHANMGILSYIILLITTLLGIKMSLYSFKLRHYVTKKINLSIITTAAVHGCFMLIIIYNSEHILLNSFYLLVSVSIYMYLKYKVNK